MAACESQQPPVEQTATVQEKASAIIGTWTPQGPSPTQNGQCTNVADTLGGTVTNEVVGAVQTLVSDPTSNGNTVYAAAANGGVWKTINALSGAPHWTAQTDSVPSLSMGHLAMDPGNSSVLLAGVGRTSNFFGIGGALSGLLLTTNGGTNWTSIGGNLQGENFTAVAISGVHALAASAGPTGLFISSTGGTTWTVASGSSPILPITPPPQATMPVGRYLDLKPDPSTAGRYYTAVQNNGVYRTDDFGATWTNVSANNATLQQFITSGQNSNAKLAVGNDGHVYIVITIGREAWYVGHSKDAGKTWTQMDLPLAPEQNQSGTIASAISNPAGSAIVVTTSGAHNLPCGVNPLNVRVSGVIANPGGDTNANGDWLITCNANGPNNQFTLQARNGIQGAVSSAGSTGGTFQRWSGLHPGGQANNTAILVDSTNSNIVYLSGDDWQHRQSFVQNPDFTAVIWRGNSSVPANSAIPSAQWANLVNSNTVIAGGGTKSNSAPHADSRSLAMSNGNLLFSSDGGAYLLNNPTTNTGDWISIIGDLQVTELHDVAYDSVSGKVIGAAQDTGIPQQQAAPIASGIWNDALTADGDDVAVDTTTTAGQSIRYSATQALGNFQSASFNATGTQVGGTTGITPTFNPPLPPAPFQLPFVTRFTLNKANPKRMVLQAGTAVYESFNQGASFTSLNAAGDGNGSGQDDLASGNSDNAEALYVATINGLFVRTTQGGALAQSASYPGGRAVDVVMKPGLSTTAYVISTSNVFQTTDAGATVANWTDITGELVPLKVGTLRSVTYVAGTGRDLIVVGTDTGVYATSTKSLSAWSRVGTNLPNAIAYDLDYNAANDVLVVGTLGRGAWTFTGLAGGHVPPIARCKPTFTVSADAVCLASISAAAIDNGSSSPDGTAISLSIAPPGPLTLGSTNMTLTVTDAKGATDTCTTAVTVIDTTPPVVTAPADVDAPVCNGGSITVGTATATDNCAKNVAPTGSVVSLNGVPLNPPIPVNGGQVTLGFGTFVIQWTATDASGNTSQPVSQQVVVAPKIEAAGTFAIDDRAKVTDTNGGFGEVLNDGNGLTSLGEGSISATITSIASVQLVDRSTVTGNVVSGGTISPLGHVSGTRTPNAHVVLPSLPALPAFPPQNQAGFTLNGTRTITPASYGDIILNSGATLVFTGGDFFVHSLALNSATLVRVQVLPETRVFVQSSLDFRTPFVNASGQVQPILLGFAGSSLVVETQFDGTLVAPNASVAFGIGSGVKYTGSFYAKSIEIRPDSALVCNEGPTPALPGNPPPASCFDGVKDGSETAVDCGGPDCAACANGKVCLVGTDCQSGDCAGGVCQQPTAQLSATRRIFADWGSGYCADLLVDNPTSKPTKTWTVTVNTGLSTIYDTWNGTFSQTTGQVTVNPEFSWNQSIAAGGVDQSVGFCANRTPPTSAALPVVVSATGTF